MSKAVERVTIEVEDVQKSSQRSFSQSEGPLRISMRSFMSENCTETTEPGGEWGTLTLNYEDKGECRPMTNSSPSVLPNKPWLEANSQPANGAPAGSQLAGQNLDADAEMTVLRQGQTPKASNRKLAKTRCRPCPTPPPLTLPM